VSLVAIGRTLSFPDSDDLGWNSSTGTFTFDGSADLNAVVFHIPATGTISNVHYRIASVTSPVLTLRTELRTVDVTTGLPNAAGTLYGSSTSITVANPTTGNKTAAVNCTGATAGDLVALVFDLSAYTSGSFTFSDSICNSTVQGGSVSQIFPYSVRNTTGSTAVAVLSLNDFALEYGTQTYYPLEFSAICGSATSGTVANSGTTRRGNRFRALMPMRASGMYVFGDLDGDCLLRLRLASDDSILATATVDKDVRGGTGRGWHKWLFDSVATVSLTAGVDYYALLEGNSATTSAIYFLQNIPNTNQLNQLSGQNTCYGTSYAGSYTDSNATRYAVGILYDLLWVPDNLAGLHPIEAGIAA
jgi:hypothetical protein